MCRTQAVGLDRAGSALVFAVPGSARRSADAAESGDPTTPASLSLTITSDYHCHASWNRPKMDLDPLE